MSIGVWRVRVPGQCLWNVRFSDYLNVKCIPLDPTVLLLEVYPREVIG